MKFSTVLTSALASLAIASPAATKREAPHQSPDLLTDVLNKLDVRTVPLDLIADLHQCLSGHPNFRTDYSKAADGVFTITNVDHTCCEKAKAISKQVPEDRYGHVVYTEPCDGATATGVSKQNMAMLRSFFDSV